MFQRNNYSGIIWQLLYTNQWPCAHLFLHDRVKMILHFAYLLQLDKIKAQLGNCQIDRNIEEVQQGCSWQLCCSERWKRKSLVHSVRLGAECSVNRILSCHCWFKCTEWPKRAPPPRSSRLGAQAAVTGQSSWFEAARKASKHCQAHMENKIHLKLGWGKKNLFLLVSRNFNFDFKMSKHLCDLITANTFLTQKYLGT